MGNTTYLNEPLGRATIDALSQTITGGSANASPDDHCVGLYRSAGKLRAFFNGVGLSHFRVDGSRVPSVEEFLSDLNKIEGLRQKLVEIIEAVTDPRDYLDEPGEYDRVIEYLNQRLSFDGLELRPTEGRPTQLIRKTGGGTATRPLQTVAECLELDTVLDELRRAHAHCETDPASAVTAACCLVESACQTILAEAGQGPAKMTVTSLWKATAEQLGLASNRTDLPADVADASKRVLGGLASTVDGLGLLRDKMSSAHGRPAGRRLVDPRMARLAVGSAEAITQFLIETWQRPPRRAVMVMGQLSDDERYALADIEKCGAYSQASERKKFNLERLHLIRIDYDDYSEDITITPLGKAVLSAMGLARKQNEGSTNEE